MMGPDRPEEQQAREWEHAQQLFEAGRQANLTRDFQKAHAAFVDAEAAARGLAGRDGWRFWVRIRQGSTLMGLGRWEDALTTFDALAADVELCAIDGLDRDALLARYPDDVPAIYWGRVTCMDELERFSEARAALPALFGTLAAASTRQQRALLAEAYLEHAKLLAIDGDYGGAFTALESTIALCGEWQEPWTEPARRRAEQRRSELASYTKQQRKTRSFWRRLPKRRPG